MRLSSRPAAAAVAVAGFLLVLGAGPAAADSFRYWGFYQWSDGAWTFAQTGPDLSTPADETVEGWRFAVADETSTRYPRSTVDFATLCGSLEAAAGQKRVGVVLDFGTDADSPDGTPAPDPRGACAVVDAAATSTQVLEEAVTFLELDGGLRVEGGLICAIAGYPGTGCGDPVAGAAPTDDVADVDLSLPNTGGVAEEPATPVSDDSAEDDGADDGGVPMSLVVGGLAVAAVGAGAVVVARRRTAA